MKSTKQTNNYKKRKKRKETEKKQQISYKREENYEMNSNNWLIHGIFR